MDKTDEKKLFSWGKGSPEFKCYRYHTIAQIEPLDGVIYLETAEDGREVLKICIVEHLNNKKINLCCRLALVDDDTGKAIVVPELEGTVLKIGSRDIKNRDFFALDFADGFIHLCRYLAEHC